MRDTLHTGWLASKTEKGVDVIHEDCGKAQNIIIWLCHIRFLSGMDPMISSQNCTLQQSSVNCRNQCVCMKVSLQNVSTHVGVPYACRKCCITTRAGRVLTYCKLSAVKRSEAEPRSNCLKLPATSSGTKHVVPSQDEAVFIPEKPESVTYVATKCTLVCMLLQQPVPYGSVRLLMRACLETRSDQILS